MKPPLISVVMPVYNAEKYLKQSIESVLQQTFTDFELLIFNDCSTDGSLEIIKSFNDSRIQIIDSPVNTGYVKHLNDGLDRAKGTYIARMDADDICIKDRFEKQVAYLDANPEVVACGAWIEFIGTRDGILKYPSAHQDILTHLMISGNMMAHPSVMMRNSVLVNHHIRYDRSLEPAEDYDMWVRLAGVGKLYNLPEVLLKYRMHDMNESVVKKEKQINAVDRIRRGMIDKWRKNADNTNDVTKVLLDFLSGRLVYEKCGKEEVGQISDFCYALCHADIYTNDIIVKTLTPKFIQLCKVSRMSGVRKAVAYIRFPKDVFSIRTCWALAFNKK